MYRLWEANNYLSDLIIYKIRIDKGLFDSYDGAVEHANDISKNYPSKLTTWEIDFVHPNDYEQND